MQIHRRATANDCGAICDNNNTLTSCAVHTMEEISVERSTCIVVQVIQTNLYLYDFVKGHLFTPPYIVL